MADIRAAMTGEAFSVFSDSFGGATPDDALYSEAVDLFGDSGGETIKSYVDLSFDSFLRDAHDNGVASAMADVRGVKSPASLFGNMMFLNAKPQYASVTHWERFVSETAAHPPSAPDHDVSIPQWAAQSPPSGETGFATTYADVAPE